MIERVLRFSLNYPFVVIILTALMVLYGIFSLARLPIDAVPDITNNQVQINTSLPGFSPVQMEQQVTYVIETALSGISGLQMTRSISRNAFSQVTAIFNDDVNVYFARQQINERLNAIKENLPQGAEPKMGPIATGLGEIYMWTVSFKHPEGEGASYKKGVPGWQEKGVYLTPEGELLKTPVEQASYLRTVQDWIIKPQLKGISGLAEVDSIGGYVRQYHVEPNIERLIALGLNFSDVISSLQKNNISQGPGYIEKGGESFLVKSDERLEASPEIENIVVATRNGIPIRIQDIADVHIGKEMRTGSATYNGNETVVGTAIMLIGENSRTVSQAVNKRLAEVDKTLPPDIETTTVINRTKLVNATIVTVIKNLGEGALLVIAILFLFLGNFRAALITALVIPFSMFLAAIGMLHTKISGNLMSLGAIDFGLIVDGAVIITENCLRRLTLRQHQERRLLQKSERLQELLIASKEMIQPTVFGQAIIIIVYIPILTLRGIEGKMFQPMAMTVIFALVSAFILSITFVPAAIVTFVKGPFREKESRILSFCKKIYAPLLKNCLKFPRRTILSGASVFAISLFIFYLLGQEFVPTLDEKDIAMHAIRIPSTSLTQSTEMQRGVEKTLMEFPEVAYVFSKTGTAEMATDPMPPNVSDTFIILKSPQEWPNPKLDKIALIESLQEKLQAQIGNNYEFTQPIEMRFNELISGARSDLVIKIYGDHFDAMQRTGHEIARELKKIRGAEDVKVAQTEGLPVLDVKIDREAASRLGINISEGLDILSIASGGGQAGQLFEGDRRFDILVKLPESQRTDIKTLENIPIPLPVSENRKTPHFPYVPLSEIAHLKIEEGLNEVQRENGKRFVAVEANIRGRDLGSFVEEAKKNIFSNVKVPKGYWLEWGGQFENLQSARQTLLIVVPVCLALIFFLLYTALNSLKHALLVFTGVPLALSGGIVALWITRLPFSISAAVGFIALSGIAVLNGLVLVSFTNQLIKENNDIEDSIINGALIRLRPVLMTALVASLGFLPMALAMGTGAEVQKPLAVVVIGGLMSSTLLTLGILPPLYKLFSRKDVR